jgi:Fe-S cluster biogenesis protein NfuA
MAVNIQLEWTPNPSTLKYVVDRALLPRGALNFTRREDAAAGSPLARKLMDIEGVVGVMIGSNFITVTKGDVGEWDVVNDAVMAALDAHLGAGEQVVDPALLEKMLAPQAANGDTEQRIRDILDQEIRPAVQGDGGDITLDRYEAGVVYLHMRGSCSGCPSSTATLKMGIESRLREAVPELVEVVAV